MAGKSTLVEVAFIGNTRDLEASLVRSGVVAEDASKKIQGSAADAGRAAAKQAEEMGASAADQESAAGRAAAAFVEMASQITKAQRAAGDAAAGAARQMGESVDQQKAAYVKAVAAQREYEQSTRASTDAQKAAADASAELAEKIQLSAQAAARSAAEQAAAVGASADDQAAAAARAAAAFTEQSAAMSRAQRAAGEAAAEAAQQVGASVDAQKAAYDRAVSVQGEYEAAMRKAADEAKAAADAEAAAVKASADEQEAAQKRAADAARASADEQAASAERAKAAATGLSEKFAGAFGMKPSTAGMAAFAAAAYEGVKGATSLQKSMEMLHTQAGVAQSSIGTLTSGVLHMAGAVGQSPEQLSAGLYHVASQLNATLPPAQRVSTELGILRTAAEGAKVGNANLEDVTNALGAAIVSNIQGVQNYSKAMGSMNAIVGAGDMKMQDLAEAFGTGVLAQAHLAGVSIQSLGGALATLGDNFIRGAHAGTLMASTLRIMKAPSEAGAEALASIGLKAGSLAQALRSGGIVGAIEDLKTHLQDSGATANETGLILTRAFGGRQSAGVQILLDELDRLRSKTLQVGQGANTFQGDWQSATHNLSTQLEQLKATTQALADAFGSYLIPKLEAVGTAIQSVIAWMQKHQAVAKTLAAVIEGVLGVAVATFAYTRAVAFVGATKAMAAGIGSLAARVLSSVGIMDGGFAKVGPGAAAMEAEVTAAEDGMVAATDTAATAMDVAIGSTGLGLILIGLGVAATELATHWSSVWSGIQSAAGTAVEGIEEIINGLISDLNQAIGAIDSALSGLISTFNSTIGQITGSIGGASIPNIPSLSVSNPFTGGAGGGGGILDGVGAAVGGVVSGATGAARTASGYTQMPTPGGGSVSVPNSSLAKYLGGSGGGGGSGSTGGSGGSSAPHGSSGSVSGWSSSENSVANQIMAAAMSQGLTKAGAAALVGNAFQESSLNPNMDVGAAGVGLWSAAEPGAGSSARSWDAAHGSSVQSQVQWVLGQLSPSLMAQLKSATDPQQAAEEFEQSFEHAGIPDMSNRTGAAQQAFSSLSGGGGGVRSTAAATATIPAAVATMLSTAQALVGAPYNHAGEHYTGWEPIEQLKKIGVDCSGFVSAVLHSGGLLSSPQSTQGLWDAPGMQPGKGQYVTIYDRHTGPEDQEHVIMSILGHFFESGGQSGSTVAGGGVHPMSAADVQSELAGGGFQAYHPTIPNGRMVTVGGVASAGEQGYVSYEQALEKAMQAALQALTNQGNSMLKTFNDAIQNGTVKTLENTLGVSTAGSISTQLNTVIGRYGATATVPQLTSQTGPANWSAWEEGLTKTLSEVHGKTLSKLAKDIGDKHGAALSTLVEQLTQIHGAAFTKLENKLLPEVKTRVHGKEVEERPTKGPLASLFKSLQGGPSHYDSIEQVLESSISGVPQWQAQLGVDLSEIHGRGMSTLDKDLGVKQGASASALVKVLAGEHGKGLAKLVSELDKTRNGNLAQLAKDVKGGPALNPQQGKFDSLVAELEATHVKALQQLAAGIIAAHEQAMNALAEELYAAQLTKDAESLTMQATQLKDQTQQAQNYGQAMLTVAQAQTQLMADTDADTLTIAKDQAQAVSNATQAQTQAATNAEQALSDATQAQTTYVKDMTQVVQDQVSGMATAVKDQTTLMSDASTAAVDAINSAAQVQADTLQERGKFGLDLVVQQLQVQLDVLKQGFDQQVNLAQQQLDSLQTQADAAENAAQVNLDQVTVQQDQLTAQAQGNLNTVTLQSSAQVAAAQAHLDAVTVARDQANMKAQVHQDQVTVAQDQRIATAQAHVDATTLSEDIKVQTAQTKVDLSANAPKSEQDIYSAQLAYAQAAATEAINKAQAAFTNVSVGANAAIQAATSAFTATQDASNAAIQAASAAYQSAQDQAAAQVQQANAAYTNAQNTSAAAIQAAQTQLTAITGQYDFDLAQASQGLTSIQSTAAQQEAALQGKISVTQAAAQTQYAGEGLVVNITGVPTTDAGAIASEVGWALRTVVPY